MPNNKFYIAAYYGAGLFFTLVGLSYFPEVASSVTNGGWAELIIHAFSRFSIYPHLSHALLILNICLFVHLIYSLMRGSSPLAAAQLISLILIMTNPLIIWFFTSTSSFFAPAIGLLFFQSAYRLKTEGYSNEAITFGILMAVFVLLSLTMNNFMLPFLAGLMFLIPFRVFYQHGLTSLLILLAPLLISYVALIYWQWSFSSLSIKEISTPVLQPNIWQSRHTGNFLTALIELAVWSLLITPLIWRQIFIPNSMSLKLFSVFALFTSLTAGALASDQGTASAPYMFLGVLYLAQIVLFRHARLKYALVYLYISWLGSVSVYWFYAL